MEIRFKSAYNTNMDRELFRFMTDDSPDMYSLTDAEGNYTLTSEAHSRLGYEPDALVGQNAFSLIHPDDFEMIRLALATQAERKTLRFRFRRQNGTYVHLETRGFIFRDDKGAPEAYLFRSRISPDSDDH